jgi:hypothetical protein
MTREEKCELAIERGVTYNPETGVVTGASGKEITRKHKEGYIIIALRINNNKVHNLLAHQFAWYWVNKECVEQIDHINRIRDDNRICNLRSVTHQQNQMNRTTTKGYTWDKRVNKWLARIKLNYKSIHLGYFKTEEDARDAYITAKDKYHII